MWPLIHPSRSPSNQRKSLACFNSVCGINICTNVLHRKILIRGESMGSQALYRVASESTRNTLPSSASSLGWSGGTVVLIPMLCCLLPRSAASVIYKWVRQELIIPGYPISATNVLATGIPVSSILVSPAYLNAQQLSLPVSSQIFLWVICKWSWKWQSCWWPQPGPLETGAQSCR